MKKKKQNRVWLWVLLFVPVTGLIVMTGNEQARAQTTRVPVLPAIPYSYTDDLLPRYYTQGPVADTDNMPANNPVTDAGAALGRVLFYDVNLSVNNTISCSSCHVQAFGFADPDALSTGLDGGLTGRNSMSLANARYYDGGAFFWDHRADTLEVQVLMPIQDEVEMGMDLGDLEAKLADLGYYDELFTDAFGTDEITSNRISLALAQFVRAMVSYRSPFDEGVELNFSTFSALEEQGRQLFNGRGRCDNCHETNAHILDQPRNIGLDATTTDLGLAAHTGNVNDEGKFKVPSLRNIEVTAPYMHDGRFATLEDVIEFYDRQIQPHPNLDPILENANGQPRRFNFTGQEKDALLAYLRTLTDTDFLMDERFSDPFVSSPSFQMFLPFMVR